MENERIQKLATLAKARREIASVKEKIPTFVPYSGPVPKTIDELHALPEPWRKQVMNENSGLIQDLANRAEIARQIAASDADATARCEALRGLPFGSLDEFNAMSPADRESWSEKMTDGQKRILVGETPKPENEGWL